MTTINPPRIRSVMAGRVVSLVLAVTLFLFFWRPPFTDLLPFLVPRAWRVDLPPVILPVLLSGVLFAWLWNRTPEGWLLFLARCTAALPVILILSVLLLPELLLKQKWLTAIIVLFLLAPVCLALASPALKMASVRRRGLFIICGWLLGGAFVALCFLLCVRANPFPLGASFAFLTGLLAVMRVVTGKELGRKRAVLTAIGILLLVAASLQAVLAVMIPGNDRQRLHKDAILTTGPYLQNLQTNSVTVMWQTSVPLPGRVLVSARKDALNLPCEGAQEACRGYDGPRATNHEILAGSLAENSVYYYRVVCDGVPGEIGRFQTAAAGQEPFDFAVYGDSQEVFSWAEYLVRNKHKDVCASILSYSPEIRFAAHVGDMTFLGNERERWDREFFTPAHDLMRDTVIWPAIGNHELNASWYFDFFSLPNEDEHYYSFDFGNSRFIFLAVEGYAVGHEYGPPTRTPMEPGSPQYTWLERTLASSQHKTWRFVFFHHAAFASGIEGSYTPARSILVPLFEQYHVDAVFSGHNHDYEFSVKNDIAYIVTGGGGGPVNLIQPDRLGNPYSRYFRGTWHYCAVHVDGQHLAARAIDLKGRAFHHFEIDKTAGTNRIVEE